MTMVQDLPIEERLFAQLNVLPYDIGVNEDGHLILTPKSGAAGTYDELAESGMISREFSSWKVETNAQRQIILMPSPDFVHQAFEGEIMLLLGRLLPAGKPIPEIGVQTTDGTKKPDVIWASSGSLRNFRSEYSFSQAPELCVEVISPSNTRREIIHKRQLYFEAGAQEVWLCDKEGIMSFYVAPETIVPRSRLCPEFPSRIDPFAD